MADSRGALQGWRRLALFGVLASVVCLAGGWLLEGFRLGWTDEQTQARVEREARARLDAMVAASGLPRERVRDWAGIVGVHC